MNSAQSKNSYTFDNRCFPAIAKKVVRIMLCGPPFDQSNCEKASPYQLPCKSERYQILNTTTQILRSSAVFSRQLVYLNVITYLILSFKYYGEKFCQLLQNFIFCQFNSQIIDRKPQNIHCITRDYASNMFIF